MKILIPILALAFTLTNAPQASARDHHHHGRHHHSHSVAVHHRTHHHHHHHHGYYRDGVWYETGYGYYDPYYVQPRRDVSVSVPGVGTYRESRW